MQDAADAELPYRARPSVRIGATAWPLFALLGGLATGASFLTWADAPVPGARNKAARG